MSRLFKGLKKGLEEALEHAEGKITLKSEIIEIPETPAEYRAKEIKRKATRRRAKKKVLFLATPFFGK